MEANELRIGNLVYVFGEIVSVEEICKNKTLPNKIGIIHKTTWSSLDICDPVPLNSEWLLKFGFVRNTNYHHECFEIACDIIEISFIKGSLILSASEPTGPSPLDHIKYVHQLQNLYFALTFKELIYNPKVKL